MGNMTDKQKRKHAETAAAKLTEALEIAGSLTDEEIEVLKESRKQVVAEREQYQGIGMMFDPGSSDARMELFNQGIARIDHLLGLNKCLDRKIGADVKYAADKMRNEKMAGL